VDKSPFGAAGHADPAKDAEKADSNLRIKSMKKAAKATKPAKAKAPSQKGQINPISDVFKNMDEDMVTLLRQAVQEKMDLDSDLFGPEDPVDLFAEFLETCAQADADEAEKNELLSDLIVELSNVKVSANGGNRQAREEIQAIYDLLDHAIENHALHPVDMMMTGKIFTDAGLAVPDSLRQAMGKALQAAPPDQQGVGGLIEKDIVSSLAEVADQAGNNPFDVYEYLNSLLAGFPSEASAALLSELVSGNNHVINQAVAGFLLHPDSALAQSAADALTASAAHTAVESSLIERLVRMRPWLPQTRQAYVDATIRAMRLNALPPVKIEVPKVIKCYVSVCDGSGTRSATVTQRVGARYQIASVMMKTAGVADALVFPELAKTEMDGIVRDMKSSMLMTETNLPGIARMLGLAIADNFTSENPPPFKLVEVVESLGLGPVHPDHASPAEIINGVLADLTPEQTNAAAVAISHADILDSEFSYQWFEAGEALDDLLYPVKGTRQRVAKLMKSYLPERRRFWARQCAISALVMRGDEKANHSPWRQLALVGRDLASDLPLDQIPLMKRIAELSVRAFEGRL
jgi:hypothetical protein